MNHANLKDMVKGWFVGGFNPTAFSTEACEVAVKSYKAGEKESAHYHKVATEITLILSGRVRMGNNEWSEGDIVVLDPGDVTDFEAITDAVNVVVKTPGALNDKYNVEIEL
ncbi:quercetin dioxygenase-like cupin family protein [Undibacterium sp. GrIS 1.8]|uniref:cupin domain-containing protein n=1 Tax=Undibacterium sp. GrIS 1.8 TaxID=3143934 RepID=UPI00339B9599